MLNHKISKKTDKVPESAFKDWIIKYKINMIDQRLGQSFANYFFDKGYSDNKLFYQEDNVISLNYILKNYMDYSR